MWAAPETEFTTIINNNFGTLMLLWEYTTGAFFVASFPGLLRLQFLITCSMQKQREKAWGISSRDPRHDRQISSRLLSTAKWYTRPILHSVLATKMGQAPAESYTKRMKHTQAKSHDPERLQSDGRENAQQWRNHLVERKDGTIWSCSAYITAIPQRLSFEPRYVLQVGLTSPLELSSIL